MPHPGRQPRTIVRVDPTPSLTLDRATARRFLVRRHLLAPPRSLPADPASVLTVMDRLGSLQFDPLDIAGRNHDLVLGARIAGYRRAWTDGHLYQGRTLYETYNKGLSIVPTAELPWYRITWDRFRSGFGSETFDEHAPLVEELLERIRTDGPLSAGDLEPRAAIDWYWRPTNQVRAILEALAEAGILGLRRRDGNRRVYDLVERLFPAELLEQHPPVDEQLRHKMLSRYRAHGLLGTGGQQEIFLGLGKTPERTRTRETLFAEGTLVPVEVEGVKGRRFIVDDERGMLEAARAELARGEEPGRRAPGVAFLAPLDPLAWDRELLRRLFDFDYVWEVYVPAAKRRWGYYVLPILSGDAIVGRIEPRFDRKARTLKILAVWWQEGFDPLADPRFAGAFADAVAALAATGDATRIEWPKAARHRPFVRAVKGAIETAAERSA